MAVLFFPSQFQKLLGYSFPVLPFTVLRQSLQYRIMAFLFFPSQLPWFDIGLSLSCSSFLSFMKGSGFPVLPFTDSWKIFYFLCLIGLWFSFSSLCTKWLSFTVHMHQLTITGPNGFFYSITLHFYFKKYSNWAF